MQKAFIPELDASQSICLCWSIESSDVSELPVEERCRYVFEGNSQVLDHLLVSPELRGALVPGGFDIVHVNAEYADQVSDHDPLVARFELLEP